VVYNCRATGQAVSCRLLTAETLVEPQGSPDVRFLMDRVALRQGLTTSAPSMIDVEHDIKMGRRKLIYMVIVKVKAECSSETLVYISQTTLRHIP
jgi:hypothetical protein